MSPYIYLVLIRCKVHAQVLLLAAGYVHRQGPLRLSIMMRSGAHLSVVSNRLAASSPRARFLGMVVGEALSSLVDKGDKKMDFKMDEMNTAEAKWYKSLVNVSDTIGSLEHLRSGSMARVPKRAPACTAKAAEKPKAVHRGTKIVAIEEIEADEEEEPDDDGLVPHAKPDSDAEDSDEDPTLITRNKPTAPVYIRDLITYLRDTASYDKQKLGLQTAASLIRRKANFGTEVISHAEELATLLVGIQDKYEIDNFQDMRLQGMIAILIALPLKMGQWYSKTFFDGDYSISQRASILTTLGIGARELGGFGAEDSSLTSAKPLPSSSSFQSKALPESMHKIYAFSPPKPLDSTASAVEALSTQLSNTMIAPMAADLADKLTGPSLLKVRTFSSRMAVEAKRKKPIANSLAKIVADGVFFPLTGRFFMHLKAYGSSHNNIAFQPHLLTLFVKTLGLLIHASGPSTLSLPQMTSEFWDLLLSLRAQSIGDVTVIEALLFAFLTILEINEDKRRLVEAHGRQMLETQEWVEGVFGRLGSGGSEEDERVRMLAAGCLVRIREVVEKYQALLMGDLANF
jgi:telomere length regulation protein